MAVVTLENLIERIATLIGESPDDESLSVLDDMRDSFGNGRTTELETENTRLKEENANLRERYRKRFFRGGDSHNEDDFLHDDCDSHEEKKLTYDKLWEEK